VIFYEGPSQLTGDPIVAVVTGLDLLSANRKTGPMAQAWIIRSDMSPQDAVLEGKDDAVCGQCEHRGQANLGRSCYVIWWQGPANVYRAYKRNDYRRPAADDLQLEMIGHHVRFGAYGDPAALPYKSWLPLVRGCSSAIGYTAQWRTCDPMFARICMASVSSQAERLEAKALGWRTFRTRLEHQELQVGEVVCPASHEAKTRGIEKTCQECRLCQGTTLQASDVAIYAHGNRVRFFRARHQAEA
jgi:hypothetical protein